MATCFYFDNYIYNTTIAVPSWNWLNVCLMKWRTEGKRKCPGSDLLNITFNDSFKLHSKLKHGLVVAKFIDLSSNGVVSSIYRILFPQNTYRFRTTHKDFGSFISFNFYFFVRIDDELCKEKPFKRKIMNFWV